jgi:hypothetical protein
MMFKITHCAHYEISVYTAFVDDFFGDGKLPLIYGVNGFIKGTTETGRDTYLYQFMTGDEGDDETVFTAIETDDHLIFVTSPVVSLETVKRHYLNGCKDGVLYMVGKKNLRTIK